jgi:hypothetical protein
MRWRRSRGRKEMRRKEGKGLRRSKERKELRRFHRITGGFL